MIRWAPKSPLRAIAVFFSALCLMMCVAVYALISSFESVYEETSPTNVGSAIFFSPVEFRASSLQLFVRDYETSGKPLFIAYVEDGDAPITFGGATWSKDGTVIAVDAVSSDNVSPPYGYDFRNHVIVSGHALEKLLLNRGGPGRQIFSNPNHKDEKFHHPWPWEM